MYNNFPILAVKVRIVLSYYKSDKETRRYNSSSTRCNLRISFYSFFNSNLKKQNRT